MVERRPSGGQSGDGPARVLVVLGTRPEAVKLAPVITRLRTHAGLQPIVCATGQHRELLAQTLAAFGLKPDHALDLMSEGQPLAEQFAGVHTAVATMLGRVRPCLAVVQGDTATAAAGALAAFYSGVPVAHVEAGLRTGRMDDPFPEEGNRRLITTVAQLHFAPTATARANLLREGVAPDAVHVTGNPVIDALQTLRAAGTLPDVSDLLPAGNGPLVLVTLHRRENWGERMAAICRGLRRALECCEGARLVFPIHPNPAVRRVVLEQLGGLPRSRLLEPLDYPAFIALINRAALVVTDSGGLQEEAPALGVPVLVARGATERPEAIAAGVARLAGVAEEQVCRAVTDLLTRPAALAAMARAVNPFGDGHAAERIVAVLAQWAGVATPEDRDWLERPWTTDSR